MAARICFSITCYIDGMLANFFPRWFWYKIKSWDACCINRMLAVFFQALFYIKLRVAARICFSTTCYIDGMHANFFPSWFWNQVSKRGGEGGGKKPLFGRPRPNGHFQYKIHLIFATIRLSWALSCLMCCNHFVCRVLWEGRQKILILSITSGHSALKLPKLCVDMTPSMFLLMKSKQTTSKCLASCKWAWHKIEHTWSLQMYLQSWFSHHAHNRFTWYLWLTAKTFCKICVRVFAIRLAWSLPEAKVCDII